MSEQMWTIQSIEDALSNPVIIQRFAAEIRMASTSDLLAVFTKWQTIAAEVQAAADKARSLAPYAERGEALPGTWVDVTDRMMNEARGAA